MARHRRCSSQTLALLTCLADKPREWCHGYDLTKATGIPSGTLYPILIRLSDRGLLESQWQASAQAGKPPRHLYRLTARGVDYASQALEFRDSPRIGRARASRA